jgi:hypothetical protein
MNVTTKRCEAPKELSSFGAAHCWRQLFIDELWAPTEYWATCAG